MKTREEIEKERQDEQDDLYRTDGGKEVPSGAGRGDDYDDEVRFRSYRLSTTMLISPTTLESTIQSGKG